jgi:ABC-type branched-subunit amino acid transport system substrate-binding protein
MLDRRAFGLLGVAALLVGCSAGSPYANRSAPGSLPPAPPPRVAILVPLKSGSAAPLGLAMVNAAHVALDVPNAPTLDALDTGGTPAGAADAARQAIQNGAKLIIGPLTAAETSAVAPLAKAAGVPVLAFTSDVTRAQAGIWTMGLTPAQQISRLVSAAQADGKTRFAAALPNNPFGDALADALRATTASLSLPPPTIRRYGGSFNDRSNVMKDITGYASRRGPIDARVKAARASGDADARQQAADAAKEEIPPPPFDVLLLAESGENLRGMTALLAYYDVSTKQVRLIGPGTWSTEIGKNHDLGGAWYAAPDPAARASYVQRYQAKYGGPPPPLSDLAYDAAAIGRVLAHDNDFSPGGLTRPDGFAGVDGVLGLQPDGRVRRGLAVFEIGKGAPTTPVQPAPAVLATPGV